MKANTEAEAQASLQEVLHRIAPGRFMCVERKTLGSSVIGKPVDLHIKLVGRSPPEVMAVELANVNTTQLVSETCRLYYDCVPLKLLVLGPRNVPSDGRALCEKVLCRLYGQDDIRHTPARVVHHSDDAAIERGLRDLLLL